jgi:hypothetical protein
MELIFMQQIINEIYITFTEIFKKELEKWGSKPHICYI